MADDGVKLWYRGSRKEYLLKHTTEFEAGESDHNFDKEIKNYNNEYTVIREIYKIMYVILYTMLVQ
jgi:hypothetical protein